MKKKSAILLSLAALALSIGAVGAIATGTDLLSAAPVAVKAADEQVEELALVFPDDNKAKNTVGSYTQTWTAKSGSTEFSIANFNNNNNNWAYIKCGSKNAASVASIATKTALPEAIGKASLTIDSMTKNAVNSIKLIVSSDAAFGETSIIETHALDISKNIQGKVDVTIENPTANAFYKWVFDCSQGTKNGFVVVSALSFTEAI